MAQVNYRAYLMGPSGPVRETTFAIESTGDRMLDQAAATREANGEIDPMKEGRWVSVQRLPDPE